MTLTHSTVVVVADDPTYPVGTDEWNADHLFTGGAAGQVLYQGAADVISSSAVLTLVGANVTIASGVLIAPAGTLAAPTYSLAGDAERGLYLQASSTGIAGGAHVTGPLTVAALATPGAITVTPMGTTGATTYTYKLVATVGGVTTEAGAASSTATGNATLDGTNFNRLTWTAVSGATGGRIYRTVGGATQGLIATIALGATGTVDDTGLAGGGETAPTVNLSGQVRPWNGTATVAGIAWDSSEDGVYGYGFAKTTTYAVGVITGGVERLRIADASGSFYGTTLNNESYLGWNSGAFSGATTPDIMLWRDAANTLALRNGTAAQTLNIYGTYTDASNYIRSTLAITSTNVGLSAVGLGTGATANVDITLTPINTGRVKIGSPAIVTATDGSAVPALAVTNMVGSTGGPVTAAQNGWLVLKDSTGATIWVAIWK